MKAKKKLFARDETSESRVDFQFSEKNLAKRLSNGIIHWAKHAILR